MPAPIDSSAGSTKSVNAVKRSQNYNRILSAYTAHVGQGLTGTKLADPKASNSAQKCATLCNADPSCAGFEFFRQHRARKEGTKQSCQLYSAAAFGTRDPYTTGFIKKSYSGDSSSTSSVLSQTFDAITATAKVRAAYDKVSQS